MNKLMYFLVGGTLGAVGALLLAPRSGEETRSMVADYAGTVATDAQGAAAKAGEALQNVAHQVTEKGQSALNDLQGAANNAAGAAADKNDELRAKIEAARDRIAAQVKQNAEQSAEAVEKNAPKAADKAKDVVDAAADKAKDAVSKGADAVEKGAEKVKDATK